MRHEWVASSKEMVHTVSPALFVKFLFVEFVIVVDIWDLTKCDLYDSPFRKFSTYARGGAPVCRTPCVTLASENIQYDPRILVSGPGARSHDSRSQMFHPLRHSDVLHPHFFGRSDHQCLGCAISPEISCRAGKISHIAHESRRRHQPPWL